MTDLNSQIKKLIEGAAKNQWPDFGTTSVVVERPKEASHGDYSTNVALALSKKLGKNPMEIAQKIAEGIKDKLFEKVEAVAPGFINFYLSKEVFIESLKK